MVGAQRSKHGDDKSGVSGRVNGGAGSILKKKSLSGSAKKRKKIMKTQGGRHVQLSAMKQGMELDSNRNSREHEVMKSPEAGWGKLEARSVKISEKQARRNARRLDKKKEAADASRA